MDDPIVAAARLETEVVAKAPDGAVVLDKAGRPKSYPSPMKYRGNEWAQKINALLDKVDPAESGSVFAKPAETVMVGECAMATGETWGLNSEGKDVPIHPGYLLLFAVLAYALMVGIGWWVKGKAEAKAPPVDPARSERLARLG